MVQRQGLKTGKMVKPNIFSNPLSSISNLPSPSLHSKKSISPVVAVALLLVVSVVSVVGFQTWFQSYESNIFSNTEQVSDFSNLDIQTIVGGNLYLKGKLEIQSVKVNGNDCFVSGVTSENLNTIPISNCAEEGKNDIVIVTNQGVFEKTILLNNYEYQNPCPEGYIIVPGNIDLGTKNFCVMKYEAKVTSSSLSYLYDSTNMYCGNGNDDETNNCLTNRSIILESKAEYKPLTNVNQDEARILCSNLGSGYHLITDAEWVTIARNIEQISSNWADVVVGSTVASGGGLKRGNVGINDSASYDASSDPADRSLDTDSKAMLTLSNGETIWDLSGNVYEWTNDTFTTNTDSALGQSSSNWYEWTSISGYDYLESSVSTYDSNYGIGQVYADVDNAYPSGTIHAFLRGGHWTYGARAGAFALYLYHGPSYSYTHIGFRCSYTE